MWLILSTPAQQVVIGLAVAALFGLLRAHEDADGPPAASRLLWLAFVVVAWRWSLLGLFEGEFGFGGLEISLAYVGNPERHVVQGALTIVLKAWLPLAVALAAADRGGAKGLDVKSLAQALGFVLGLRAVHLAIGIAAVLVLFGISPARRARVRGGSPRRRGRGGRAGPGPRGCGARGACLTPSSAQASRGPIQIAST
jgi:hypothetical protein